MDNEFEEDYERLNIKEWLNDKLSYWPVTTLFYYINNVYASFMKTQSLSNRKNRKQHKIDSKQIDILENDEEIQEGIWNKIQEIEYDENSIESRAVAVHAIGAVLYANELIQKIEEKTDYPIDSFIAEIVNKMKIEDVMQLVEWDELEKIIHFSNVKSTIANRVNEMSEGQLIVFFLSFNSSKVCFEDAEIRRRIEDRVVNVEDVCLPFYIKYLSYDDKIISKLLDRVPEKLQVNSIISANVNIDHNPEVTEKLQKMIQNLSNIDFTRYMSSGTQENDALKPIIKDKLEQLSDEDIRFLTAMYFVRIAPPTNPYKHNELAEQAAKRGLIGESEDGVQYCSFNENIVIPKFETYRCSNRYFDVIPYFTGFDFAVIDGDNPEMSEQKMVEAFKMNSRTMGNYYKFIDYICTLSRTKDEDLYKTILDVNKDYKFPKDVDKDLTVYFKFTELYLVNRVLNMDDTNLLNRLYILSRVDLPLYDAIAIRMHEKGFSEPPCLHIIDNNYTGIENYKKRSDNEKDLGSNGLDNLQDRE